MHDNSVTGSVRIVLGFDYGTKRIGVAVGNSLIQSAQALAPIENTRPDQAFKKIAQLIAEWQPSELIVGLPFHPDGAEHGMTNQARRFGQQLQGRYTKKVQYVDERYSSVLLESDPEYQASLDSQAAALLIEQYFREQG
jgi:putative Holliday junction resolvase